MSLLVLESVEGNDGRCSLLRVTPVGSDLPNYTTQSVCMLSVRCIQLVDGSTCISQLILNL